MKTHTRHGKHWVEMLGSQAILLPVIAGFFPFQTPLPHALSATLKNLNDGKGLKARVGPVIKTVFNETAF